MSFRPWTSRGPGPAARTAIIGGAAAREKAQSFISSRHDGPPVLAARGSPGNGDRLPRRARPALTPPEWLGIIPPPGERTSSTVGRVRTWDVTVSPPQPIVRAVFGAVLAGLLIGPAGTVAELRAAPPAWARSRPAALAAPSTARVVPTAATASSAATQPPAVGGEPPSVEFVEPPPVILDAAPPAAEFAPSDTFAEPDPWGPVAPHPLGSLLGPQGTGSWRNQPWSFGTFLGVLVLDDPLNDLNGEGGFMVGGRLGYDYTDHWGLETRIAFASPGLVAQGSSVILDNPDVFLWDVNYLWYPLGDTRLRPFLSLGLGLFDLDYTTAQNVRFHDSMFQLPVGGGLKYRYSSNLALRLEFLDQVTFGTGTQNDMHNWSFTAGLECRFGGRRRSYWPWRPDRSFW